MKAISNKLFSLLFFILVLSAIILVILYVINIIEFKDNKIFNNWSNQVDISTKKIDSIKEEIKNKSTNSKNNNPVNDSSLTKAKKIYYVSPKGSGVMDGSNQKNAFDKIQKALDVVGPGEIIKLQNGQYYESIKTKTHGTKNNPIIITGTKEAIIRGNKETDRIFQIFHNHYILDGFTVNGHDDKGSSAKNYRDKLIYIQGKEKFFNNQTKKGPRKGAKGSGD